MWSVCMFYTCSLLALDVVSVHVLHLLSVGSRCGQCACFTLTLCWLSMWSVCMFYTYSLLALDVVSVHVLHLLTITYKCSNVLANGLLFIERFVILSIKTACSRVREWCNIIERFVILSIKTACIKFVFHVFKLLFINFVYLLFPWSVIDFMFTVIQLTKPVGAYHYLVSFIFARTKRWATAF